MDRKMSKENVMQTYNGILFTHKKGNPAICNSATTGVDFEGITLSETGWIQKDIYHMISLICIIKKNELIETEQTGSCRVGGNGELGKGGQKV